VRGEPEFTVNIALVENCTPILGVIFSPVDRLLYHGGKNLGAFKNSQPIKVRKKPEDGLTVVRSKSHPSKRTEVYLQTLPIKELIPGSSSIKFCKVAEGSADIYPRFGRTMEWDTAAGHAILNEAGGSVKTEDGKVLAYGKINYENPAFIAYGFAN
jgi:3'(2'), 5'-bisphosphate nucleotidase